MSSSASLECLALNFWPLPFLFVPILSRTSGCVRVVQFNIDGFKFYFFVCVYVYIYMHRLLASH